ncbi:MAG: hypothetical protein AB1714_08210 [Acidobacteriota bacterium]
MNVRRPASHAIFLLSAAIASAAAWAEESVPPRQKAQLLAPGVVCTGLYERDAAYDVERGEMYFTILSGREGTICVTRLTAGVWSKPEVVSFSGTWSDIEPCLSPDGARLYFISNRPTSGSQGSGNYDIWYMERTKDGWGEPKNPGPPLNMQGEEYYPSVTRDGTVYFCAKSEGEAEDLWRCRNVGGTYQPRENLGPNVNTKAEEFNAFVAPDESFLMYTSTGWGDGVGGGDLWIAFRDAAGNWTKPVNMGEAVNSPDFEYCPALSSDGKLLFFTSHRSVPASRPVTYDALQKMSGSPGNGNGDIYVIDSSLIDDLRKTVLGGAR